VVLTLKTPWADGTRQLVFEPLTLLERLAALTPRPRINLVLYHGVLAPHAGWRARVVGYCARGQAPVVLENATANASGGPAAAPSSRHWAWAALMRRAFEIDVLACPRWALAVDCHVEDPDAIRTILAAALSRELPDRAPPFPTAPDTRRTTASNA
jgi:hypothetical protein